MRSLPIDQISVLAVPNLVYQESEFADNHESHDVVVCDDIDHTAVAIVFLHKDRLYLIERNRLDDLLTQNLKFLDLFITN
jgi:hypothetical protein